MKVYQVNVHYDNLLDDEDHRTYDHDLGLYSTREKAKACIRNFEPDVQNDEQTIIEDPEKVETESGCKVEIPPAERVIYRHDENPWSRELTILTIKEIEVK